ncbi:TetR family transcriptional regulator [Streptomyces sp. LUP30]|uniref:TetR family transcriptional regulator n=1 Tax=Streptomyces sp. LUP30 TaxID=1890285 RepID=UPI0009A057D6|nr:TetR family transcriptional regulator [Streptomyces sp. LUP30]
MAPQTSETLTAERILEATEEVLRRHGPAKATVVDVARALGVSHGSVYRHFRTKAALREAVTKRWLDFTSQILSAITADEGRPPEARLRDWLTALFEAKRRKAGGDPELFATYMVLTADSGTAVGDHLADLTGQLTSIIEAGVAAGAFATADPAASARAVFHATGRFHDPGYFEVWERPGVEDDFTAVVDLLLRGLRASAQAAPIPPCTARSPASAGSASGPSSPSG